jgi:serine/threonine-protein kinase HipA
VSRRIEQLDTWVAGARIGRLACSPEGTWTYSYEPAATTEVALSMPRDQVVYTHQGILPPFEQNLPEMDLSLFPAGLWKLIRRDEMGLLLLGGNRRLGRVRYAEPGQVPDGTSGLRLSARDFESIEDGEKFLVECLARLADVPGISGIQPKTLASIAVANLDPARAHIDTHILKGNRADYPWATVIEFASLQAARASRLQVPQFALSRDGKLLSVERFDLDGDGQAAFGFDEACSLMGLYARDKYQGSYERLWKSMRPFIAPDRRAQGALHFFKHLCFCYAIENGDAHLKNFGLLYQEPDQAFLAPAYDLLTTTCFPALHRDSPALTLGGRKVWDCFAELVKFARAVLMLSDSQVRQTLADLHAGIFATLPLLGILSATHPAARPYLDATAAAWSRGLERLQRASA